MKNTVLIIVLLVVAFVAGANSDSLGDLLKAIPFRINFHFHWK